MFRFALASSLLSLSCLVFANEARIPARSAPPAGSAPLFIDASARSFLVLVEHPQSRQLALNSPAGQMLDPTNVQPVGRWERSDTLDAIFVERPVSGVWGLSGVTAGDSVSLILDPRLAVEFPSLVEAGGELHWVSVALESRGAPVHDAVVHRHMVLRPTLLEQEGPPLPIPLARTDGDLYRLASTPLTAGQKTLRVHMVVGSFQAEFVRGFVVGYRAEVNKSQGADGSVVLTIPRYPRPDVTLRAELMGVDGPQALHVDQTDGTYTVRLDPPAAGTPNVLRRVELTLASGAAPQRAGTEAPWSMALAPVVLEPVAAAVASPDPTIGVGPASPPAAEMPSVSSERAAWLVVAMSAANALCALWLLASVLARRARKGAGVHEKALVCELSALEQALSVRETTTPAAEPALTPPLTRMPTAASIPDSVQEVPELTELVTADDGDLPSEDALDELATSAEATAAQRRDAAQVAV